MEIILAKARCKNISREEIHTLVFHLFHCFYLIDIQCNDRPTPFVQADEPLLFQNGVRLVDCMHIDSHILRKLPHGRQGIPLVPLIFYNVFNISENSLPSAIFPI